MGRRAADKEVRWGGGGRGRGGGYGWGDGKVVGGRSGGDEGDFCLGDRQAAGGFDDGGWVCSELTGSRLLLL